MLVLVYSSASVSQIKAGSCVPGMYLHNFYSSQIVILVRDCNKIRKALE